MALLFGGCGVLIGLTSLFMVYYLYHLILLDAKSRGVKKPRGWAILAAGGQNGSGLLWYLLKRPQKKLAASNVVARQMQQLKIKIYCLLAVDGMALVFVIATMFKMNGAR